MSSESVVPSESSVPSDRDVPSEHERDPKDRGSGTVMGLALVAVLLTLTVALLGLVAAVNARGGAQTAADLGALAAATALHDAGGPDPCEVAAAVVSANDAELSACAVDGEDVTVTATVTVLAAGWPIDGRELLARADARAGPER